MSKKIVSGIVILFIVVILAGAVVLLKPSEDEVQLNFALPFSSVDELAIRDIKANDYSKDEERIKEFLVPFFEFITEKYVYTDDQNNPLKKQYNSYFTQKADNARDNYEYLSEYGDDSNATFWRAIFTDLILITGTKINGDSQIKVISKKDELLKFVNEVGSKYTVLYTTDVLMNKKISENGIFKNYGGEKVNTKIYVELEIYEYLGEFKIHNIINRNSESEIEAFKEYFETPTNIEVYSFDEMVSQIKYSKDKQNVKKYINDNTKSIDTTYIKEFDENDINRVIRDNIEEVVVINNLDKTGKINSIGSGFFIIPGVILTNWHVIDGADELKILTYDGEECKVDGIISANDKVDLALIKLKKEIGEGVTFASLENLKNSSPVVAIGHPLGNLYTVTAGTYDKTIVNNDVTFIQSQIPLLPGNSGGPLLDKNGYVIGINTAITAGDTTLTLTYKYIENVIDTLKKYDFSKIEVYK